MRNRFLSLLTLSFTLMVGVSGTALPARRSPVEQEDSRNVTQYLPAGRSPDGWIAQGDGQIARGEDLYQLIDGGAEIFHEYGFEQAVFMSYERKNGDEDKRSINLEIYEMESPAGAYGMYTFRSSERGEEVSIGNGGRLEDYYLNFWKGNVFVSVIGFDSDQVTAEGVKAIAAAVETRITPGGKEPHLVDLLPVEGLKPNGVEYLRGNLALCNNYRLSSGNIFGVKEGVIGVYKDHRVFLFSYENETESLKWFTRGLNHLKNNPDLSGFARLAEGYTMKDSRGSHLCLESCGKFILMVLGTEKNALTAMKHLKKRIGPLQSPAPSR